jgi:hypothetical protein
MAVRQLYLAGTAYRQLDAGGFHHHAGYSQQPAARLPQRGILCGADTVAQK